jgi:tRNA G10  N-methylase Trm11
MNPTFHLNDDVLDLVSKILSNAIANADDLSKYGRVNLSGKAGARLLACKQSITLLESSGFVQNTIDDKEYLVLDKVSASTEEMLEIVRQSKEQREIAKNTENTEGKSLSLKQQAQLEKEALEKAERLESYKKKKPKMSLKAEGREMERLKKLEEKENAKRVKETLLKKIEQDNYVRKHDENWTTEVAGDKSKGKSMLTFREKNGEDNG